MPPPATRRQGFTLVELLVVIGIIALLISILLPSLNKAKKQANLVYCQSQLRQMFQTAVIYSNEHKGALPFGSVTSDVDYSSNAVPEPQTNFNYSTKWPYTWTDTLSLMMGKKPQNTFQALPTEKAAIFRDLDTVEDGTGTTYPYTGSPISHYTANSRLFPVNSRTDLDTGGKRYRQRKLSSIRQPATTMAIWDGGQQFGMMLGSASPTSDNFDQYRTNGGNGHWLLYPAPAASTYPLTSYKNLVALGTQFGNTLAEVKRANVDAPTSFNPVNMMRFRHLKNDTANFAFADGHVESRPIGSVTVMDVCVKRQ